MFDHHADALPDHDLIHHLSHIDIGTHHVSTQDATVIGDVLDSVAHCLPGRLGHATAGVMDVVHHVLGTANEAVQLHDGVVDVHHAGFQDPCALI